MLADAIFQRLSGYAGLSALVGSRIYPSRAADGAGTPYVVHSEAAPIDQVPDLDGVGDLVEVRVQVDAWAETAITARQVGDQVRAALDDFTGTVGGVAIAHVTIAGGFDDYDADVSPILYRRTTDFTVTMNV
ncbi:hypothetical protein BSL82_05680 [Tardibacter chloracetimidivorans]|uniref:DUF3168 domain-containing protein n=1 Tax=Tardibacter chloracetimidivorans TaxID=1921510 RepID=A0A1L3ZTA2_9SPHN|nr:DUF3168 domain-containing protein [Tardibacter chloracetimidivorans]API58863.1 hypothetical protein BSL82_05680 [Tardibacter chloracetimidivorans]